MQLELNEKKLYFLVVDSKKGEEPPQVTFTHEAKPLRSLSGEGVWKEFIFFSACSICFVGCCATIFAECAVSREFDKVQPHKPKDLELQFKSLSRVGDIWTNPNHHNQVKNNKKHLSTYERETIPTNMGT